MAVNAQGFWEPEDDNVAPRVGAIIRQDNPLMQQARSQGLAASNRRGLLNSNLAVGSAQGSVMAAALPIAQQEAQQTFSKNMSALDRSAQMERLNADAGFTSARQQADIQAQMDRLKADAGFTGDRQTADIQAQMDRLKADAGFTGDRQTADIQAQMDRLRTDAGFTADRQTADNSAQMDRLNAGSNAELARLREAAGFDATRQSADNAAQMARLNANSASELARLREAAGFDITRQSAQNEADLIRQRDQNMSSMAQQERTIAAQMDQLNRSGQLQQQQQDRDNLAAMERMKAQGGIDVGKIGMQADASMRELQMNLAAGDRERAAGAATSMLNSQDQMLAAIASNPNIDAATRERMIRDNNARRQIALDVVGQIYDVNLTWGQGTATTSPAPAAGTGLLSGSRNTL